MNPNEEYLDNLLKSMNDKESSNEPMTSEEIEAMFAAIDNLDNESDTLLPEESLLPLPEDTLLPEEVLLPEDTLLPEEVLLPEEEQVQLPEEPENTVTEDLLNLQDEDILKELNAVMPEDTADMSEEDIDRLLGQAIAEAEPVDEPKLQEDGGGDLDEINELLRRADNNEVVDDAMLAFMQGIDTAGEEPKEAEGEPDLEEQIEETPKKKKKRVKKEKKKPAETAQPGEEAIEGAEEPEGKKQGFASKLFAFLTEEDEEPQSGELASNSEENETILKELDEEEKKGKKKKKKKDKKGGKQQSDEESDEDEEQPDKKKKKDKKPKKVKKEKPEKKKETTVPGKKVSGKKIFFVALICLTIAAFLIIGSTMLNKNLDVRSAKKAFYQGDYTESYQLLYGKKLTENESIILEKAEVMLTMERRWNAYENYLRMDKELEAVDSLIQAPQVYDGLKEKAVSLNMLEDVTAVYQKILNELSSKYKISEETARELAASEDNLEYAKKLNSYVKEKNSQPTQENTQTTPKPIEDVLPQEEELDDYNFIQ